MLRLVTAITLASCVSAKAQTDCYGTVRSVSTLTFAEIECREDFGASAAAGAVQSCATVLSEPEFDQTTREADTAFRSRVVKDGLAAVCADMRRSARR
ncbi:hypothetical protein HNR00_004032 [Methylorubrum rhodinum]|uniref:Uncharacterized protein n=1 Tax=Methylorubrum rhodinum TaxID=29428 RepID=A0A840ZPN4_9HYPH|nr:hypothetical protein [Methylorubrum rhodinum]MBB5759300.1 hypothetical protein [Methylorubrum rhodinum]